MMRKSLVIKDLFHSGQQPLGRNLQKLEYNQKWNGNNYLCTFLKLQFNEWEKVVTKYPISTQMNNSPLDLATIMHYNVEF